MCFSHFLQICFAEFLSPLSDYIKPWMFHLHAHFLVSNGSLKHHSHSHTHTHRIDACIILWVSFIDGCYFSVSIVDESTRNCSQFVNNSEGPEFSGKKKPFCGEWRVCVGVCVWLELFWHLFSSVLVEVSWMELKCRKKKMCKKSRCAVCPLRVDVPSRLRGPAFTACTSLVGINEQVAPGHVIRSETLLFRAVDHVWE